MTPIVEMRKAVGAAAGGLLTGGAMTPFLPEGTPWYGYLILYLGSAILPGLLAYLPRNEPPLR